MSTEPKFEVGAPYEIYGCGFGPGPFEIRNTSGEAICTMSSMYRRPLQELIDAANKTARIAEAIHG